MVPTVKHEFELALQLLYFQPIASLHSNLLHLIMSQIGENLVVAAHSLVHSLRRSRNVLVKVRRLRGVRRVVYAKSRLDEEILKVVQALVESFLPGNFITSGGEIPCYSCCGGGGFDGQRWCCKRDSFCRELVL